MSPAMQKCWENAGNLKHYLGDLFLKNELTTTVFVVCKSLSEGIRFHDHEIILHGS